MKISFPLLALVAFAFYFGLKTQQKKQLVVDQLSGAVLDVAKDQVNSQLSVTKDWLAGLTSQWKSIWK